MIRGLYVVARLVKLRSIDSDRTKLRGKVGHRAIGEGQWPGDQEAVGRRAIGRFAVREVLSRGWRRDLVGDQDRISIDSEAEPLEP